MKPVALQCLKWPGRNALHGSSGVPKAAGPIVTRCPSEADPGIAAGGRADGRLIGTQLETAETAGSGHLTGLRTRTDPKHQVRLISPDGWRHA